MPGPWPSIKTYATVDASPVDATETVIATMTGITTDNPTRRVDLSGWCTFTVGTNGTAYRLRIRQTSLTGTVVADSGGANGGVAAANVCQADCEGLDIPGDVAKFAYVMTLQVTAASAASTVAFCKIRAIIS